MLITNEANELLKKLEDLQMKGNMHVPTEDISAFIEIHKEYINFHLQIERITFYLEATKDFKNYLNSQE